MQFTKLRIQGFKTFVDPSDFLIKQGLTGVVGPNGCGKSNLVEALRWVMGENSYKNMRASGMDDVIFSGNNTRPSRNHAEVILTIDNSKRLAPALFNDTDILEISRKIEREAGSTYKINGKEVRARDVQLLFADASSGSRSPSMVKQGQIGEIINAKPQARRRILEEAAGISGLYARRHEAEMRLKAAESNLEKLELIFDGMKAQVETLKRQAKGAVKYRQLSEEIKRAEALVAYTRFMDVLSAVIAAEKLVESERLNVASVTLNQAETAKNQAIAQERLPVLRETAAKAGAALARLINARDMLEQEEKRARTRSSELAKLIEQSDKDIAREKSHFSDTDAVLKRLSEEKSTLISEQNSLIAKEQELSASLKSAETAVLNADLAFNAATTALAENTARKNALEREARESLERFKRVEIQMKEIETEINQFSLHNQDESKLQSLKDAYDSAFKAHGAAETEVLTAENALKAARLTFEETRKPLQDAERKAQMLETEVKTLTKLLLPPSSQKSAPILDGILVNKGYERALAAALQDDLDVTLDEAAAFHWKNIAPLSDDATFQVGIEPLYNRVKAPEALTRRLKQIGIVAKSEGATAQKLLKTGQRLVSIEGDLWRWDGLTMSSSAQSPAARRLAEKNRLSDLIEDAEKAKSALSTHKALFEVAQATLKTLSDSEAKNRDKWRQAGRLVEFARSEVTSLERSMIQMLTRKAALIESKSRLISSLNEYSIANEKAASAVANAPLLAPLEAVLQSTRQDVQVLRAKANEIRVANDTLKRDHEARDRRIASIDSEKATWARRIESANEQITSLQQRKDSAVLEQNQLESAPDYFLEKRRSLIDGIREAEQNRKDTADALSIGERMSFEADKAANDTMKAFTTVREAFVRAESVLEQIKLRKTDVETQIYEAFESAPQALPDIAKFDRFEKVPDMKQVEADLEAKKRERERLGGVNLQADSELETNEKELNRLMSERDDLIEAIKKLRSAINSLNREGRERLLASFDTVNSNFKRIFVTLFGGGTADLQLVESDDPLEAGLDIIAMPPGKKPQTMSLLSGGEQALTAIALIFAVFLTNPAPICVLDEVDAPLDDSNVERYCDLLVEMAKATSTRFLVITHNPITMARMNRLFGVTMAERGVSQLVSVDLEKAEMLIAA